MAVEPKEWDWWWGYWRNYMRCPNCRALMDLATPCPVCGIDYSRAEPQKMVINSREVIVAAAYNGPLDWAPYVVLRLMHREWCRPPSDEDQFGIPGREPSPHILVVLLFWTYFETLMSWVYETATRELPAAVQGDLLNRYSTIGSRRDRLHRLLFKTRHDDDLDQLGFTEVRKHLEDVQTQRNSFIHGNPEAIADKLVEATVMLMPEFHEAWVKSFNMRCTKRP